MDKPNKEQVYDEQIFPLMAQIIKICQDNKIAVFAQFAIPSPTDPDLHATTLLTDETERIPHSMRGVVAAAMRSSDELVATMTMKREG